MDDPLFEALYAQSAAGIAVFSIGGRFLRANPAMCRLLGYTEQELLQKTHLDVIHMEDLEAAAVARAQLISGKLKPRDAMEVTFFHWGVHAWSIYVVISRSIVK